MANQEKDIEVVAKETVMVSSPEAVSAVNINKKEAQRKMLAKAYLAEKKVPVTISPFLIVWKLIKRSCNFSAGTIWLSLK